MSAEESFLTKLSTQGFSIEKTDEALTLRPRGVIEDMSITISHTGKTVPWVVAGASGRYKGFSRGDKRKFFEDTINRLWFQALSEQ